MIDYEQQLKLQAYLDGELSGTEARQLADWVARDREAAALLTELRQTGEALKGLEDGVKLPESREFFWSKIQASSEHGERRESPLSPNADTGNDLDTIRREGTANGLKFPTSRSKDGDGIHCRS